jgi:hypothetical protein
VKAVVSTFPSHLPVCYVHSCPLVSILEATLAPQYVCSLLSAHVWGVRPFVDVNFFNQDFQCITRFVIPVQLRRDIEQ